MIWEIFWHNVYRRPVRKIIALTILWISATLITALLIGAIAGDRDTRHRLQMFGANFLIVPESATESEPVLKLGDWKKSMLIFWRNNIAAVVPVDFDRVQWMEGDRWIPVAWTWFDRTGKTEEGRELALGWKAIAGGWRVTGRWPEKPDEVMVGRLLAERLAIEPGARLRIRSFDDATVRTVTVTAVFESGGAEDRYLLARFDLLGPATADREVDRFYLRAETMPEPPAPVHFEQLSPAEQEKWLCRPYPTSIRYQLQGVFAGARVKPLQDVLYQEAVYFTNFRKVIVLLTIVVTIAMAAGMMLVMMHLVQARAREMMLFTAIGGGTGVILLLFIIEAIAMGFLAGVLGWLTGGWLAQHLMTTIRPGPPWAYPEVALLVIPGVTLIAMATTVLAVLYRWRRLSPQLLHQVG